MREAMTCILLPHLALDICTPLQLSYFTCCPNLMVATFNAVLYWHAVHGMQNVIYILI